MVNKHLSKQGFVDQYHVTISQAQQHHVLKLTAAQILVFDRIAGSSQVNLLQSGAPLLVFGIYIITLRGLA